MAMGEVVNQSNNTKIRSTNQGNQIPQINSMDPNRLIDGGEYLPCPFPEVERQFDRLSINVNNTSRSKEPSPTSYIVNNASTTSQHSPSVQMLDEHPPLQPIDLFNSAAASVGGEVPHNYAVYPPLIDGFGNPLLPPADGYISPQQQRYLPMARDRHRNPNRNSFHEYSYGNNTPPQFRPPDNNPPRRQAWSDTKARYFKPNEGYNSDSDVLASSRAKKTSWDNPSQNNSGVQMVKCHRRVRSGDAVSGFYVNNSNNANFPSYNNSQYFVSPMVHSQSQGNISIPQLEQKVPFNHQAVSVDTSMRDKDIIHQHMCQQTSAFVMLQSAIEEASREVERLEREVEGKHHELNAGLTVKQNPTHKDCQLLEAEVKHLTLEIQAMYDECDRLGAPIPGDSPAAQVDNTNVMFQPPFPPPVLPPQYSPQYPQQYRPQYPPPTTIDPPITNQPRSNNKQKRNSNPYQNVHSFNSSTSSEASASEACALVSPPPPLPPRIPQALSEHWICPKCTFKNLLVTDCEICLTPRPTQLVRQNSHLHDGVFLN